MTNLTDGMSVEQKEYHYRTLACSLEAERDALWESLALLLALLRALCSEQPDRIDPTTDAAVQAAKRLPS